MMDLNPSSQFDVRWALVRAVMPLADETAIQNHDLLPAEGKFVGGREPGDSRAHDHGVGFVVGSERWRIGATSVSIQSEPFAPC